MSTALHTLIVGGSRGIGKCVADHFTEQGHLVSVVGRDWNNKSVPDPLNYILFFQRFRGEGDAWQGELDVTLKTTRDIIERARPHFSKTGDKGIVVVSSVASQFIATEQPLGYHVGKGGLISLVKYYASSLGPHGIRVNAISPSTVIKDENKNFYETNRELTELYQKITPLKRMARAIDVANLAFFLCSPKSSFLTGQNILLDGGISLQWQESLARELALKNPVSVTQEQSGQV